jgi:ribonuclease VapC
VIVDTSALMAILRLEPEARRLLDALKAADRRAISAATLVEAGIVAEARVGEQGGRDLDAVLARLKIEVISLTESHAAHARRAYRRYGKARGHPARLNFGDCFAYALAKASGEPLLFKGHDFSMTDIEAAKY